MLDATGGKRTEPRARGTGLNGGGTIFTSGQRLKVVHTLSQSLHRSIHLVSRRLGTGHEYLVDLCSYWEPKVERGLCPRLTPGLHLLC